jgi:hypothetical protein
MMRASRLALLTSNRMLVSRKKISSYQGVGLDLQTFLLALPIGMSFSSRTMHTSSIRRICSSSYPSRSAWLALARAAPIIVVLTSGNRRRTLSAVMDGAVMVVVVLMVVCFYFRYRLQVRRKVQRRKKGGLVLVPELSTKEWERHWVLPWLKSTLRGKMKRTRYLRCLSLFMNTPKFCTTNTQSYLQVYLTLRCATDEARSHTIARIMNLYWAFFCFIYVSKDILRQLPPREAGGWITTRHFFLLASVDRDPFSSRAVPSTPEYDPLRWGFVHIAGRLT